MRLRRQVGGRGRPQLAYADSASHTDLRTDSRALEVAVQYSEAGNAQLAALGHVLSWSLIMATPKDEELVPRVATLMTDSLKVVVRNFEESLAKGTVRAIPGAQPVVRPPRVIK